MSADFWSSYLAGAAGIIIGNPLDVIKTRLQAGTPSTGSRTTRSATITTPTSCLSRTSSTSSILPSNLPVAAQVRQFPSALSYLSGAPFPIIGYGALNALLFTTYNRCLLLLGERSYSDPRSLANVWLSGAAGGVATWVVSAPTELIKCRAQVQWPESTEGAAVAREGRHHGGVTTEKSSWSIAKEVWRREGLRGLYFGGAVTSVRDAVGYGFYFWSYEFCKQSWPFHTQNAETPRKETAIQVLICGGIAGMVTWASIFPLDVIKTRVQTQPYVITAPEAEPLIRPLAVVRRGALNIAVDAYRSDGIAVFFRGLGVCSLRAFVVNAVTWLVYERMMDFMRRGGSEGLNISY